MGRRDFEDILSAEMVSLTGGVLAGSLLLLFSGALERLPGLLILLPGFLELRGSVSGALSARLSSGLLLGVLKPRWGGRILRGNVVAALAIAFIAAILLAGLAYGLSGWLFGAADARIFAVALLAVAVTSLIEVPVTVGATYRLFRRGHDPNNVMGPYVTMMGDVLSVVSLLIAVGVLL